ncbi:MAG: hypothetical protein ACK4UN_04910 [Limisphaerales bacterium]
MNIARVIFITVLLLSLFITAKSFVAVHNVNQWADELRYFFTMELGRVGQRSYPINVYLNRIESIQKEWHVLRYVSLALVFISVLGIYLVRQKRIAESSAAPNGGPAASVDNPNAPGGPPSVS